MFVVVGGNITAGAGTAMSIDALPEPFGIYFAVAFGLDGRTSVQSL
jgi:hypothetical protein